MKFRVHPSLIVYLVLIGLVDGLSNILCILVTLIVHEAGHLFVGKFFKEEYELLEITPLGGMLSYDAEALEAAANIGSVVFVEKKHVSLYDELYENVNNIVENFD